MYVRNYVCEARSGLPQIVTDKAFFLLVEEACDAALPYLSWSLPENLQTT